MELLIARGFKGNDGKTLDLDRKAGTNTIYALNAYKKSRKMTQNGICDAAFKHLIEKSYRKYLGCVIIIIKKL